ncbi:MAG: lysophospholipid acyltransferase family protein [Proteobacteria bacterium]|nr:lysophospholipid acyltransferase family protein [Pseudomonadota bacterium]
MNHDPTLAPAGFPQPPPLAPQVNSRWRRIFGILLMRLVGWRIVGNLPNTRKFVLIVAPHTSNWDFFYGALAYFVLRLDTTWLVKETAIRGPLGALAKHFGAAPIDRSHANHVVQAYLREFQKRERICLTITPEGTRKKVPEWKRGFYHVAVGAKVPILPVAFDYRTRHIVLNHPIQPTGDIDADLPRIKQYFCKEMARHPEQY